MLKVFIVEDETVIREGFRDKIPWEQYGFQLVGDAGDGEVALPLIRKIRPDVLITDIKMPFMDGLSLSEIVKEEFPKTKIIIISGYDDFEYARQAIRAGVDQYLLKPITRQTLRGVLVELREKIEQETEQQDYQDQYQDEMQEFEQFALRRFFEKILDGKLSVKEIYEEAARLSLPLTAASYNLLLFSVYEASESSSLERREWFTRKQEEVFHYFLRHPQYILFRLDVNCYGVLIKSETALMEDLADRALDHIKRVCGPEEERIRWYVAVGTPVERLSSLPQCYERVNHCFAYRFIMPALHILSETTLAGFLADQEEKNIGQVDFMQMDPDIIRDFLSRGTKKEIHGFVESYLQNIQNALKSRMFRDYVILNIRFAVVAFLESIGAKQAEYMGRIEQAVQAIHREDREISLYFVEMLGTAMDQREEINSYQGGKMLKKALEYIDANFDSETLSLNQAAESIGASANYLSAVFSQGMQKTFVEYVTEKRIEKAKKLLRHTDKTSGEIAREVGYKDARYFGFVFKKLQGCSPREYRGEGRK
ncbi:two-component system response regulator [Lachnoclostridium sp. An14]|uniref:response regulator n=1 Tax=Lachnoclostridium sp. An14 TaxID=1965562 RepID=UPI000B36C984|nr:response regulator [Lachnoclostridium sp. An14]OUQ21345.1 two-component system response regulator [Lachnoclostridium sp. An14]